MATRRKIVDFIKRRYEFFIIAFVAVLFAFTRLINLKAVPIQIDEMHIITWAQKGFKAGAVASLKFGKPPLYPMAQTLFLRVFSDPVVAARMLSAASGAATLAGIILIGKEMKDWRLGALAGLFWVICPYILWYERLGIVESMLVALMVWAVFFAVKAVISERYLYLVGTGVFLGLAMWTKQNAAVMFLVIPFAFVIRGQGQDVRSSLRQFLKFGIYTAFSFLMAYGIYNLLRFSTYFDRLGRRVYYHTRTTLNAGPFAKLPENLVHLFKILWDYVTPLLLVLAFVGIIIGLLRKWRPAAFLALWFLIMWFAASVVSRTGTGSRYWVILVPPLSLGAGYAVSELPGLIAGMMRKSKTKGIRLAVILVSLVLSAVFISAMMAPVVANDIYMVSSPEKTFFRDNLTRWAWGWGYFEAVDELEKKSGNGKVFVFVRDAYAKMVMDAYFKDAPAVVVKHSFTPRIRLAVARKETDRVYAVYTANETTEDFLREEKIYPEDNDYIRRVRLTSESRIRSGLVRLARVEVPYIGSIDPPAAPAGSAVSIKGDNFGGEPGEVRFGKTPAPVVEWTDDEILVEVPECPQWVRIRVYAPAGSSQYGSFRVVQ